MLEANGWGCLAVRSVVEARKHWPRYAAVITVEDPDQDFVVRVPAGSPTRQLVLRFEDTHWEPGALSAPQEAHVAAALSFAREAGRGSLMVHCYAGVSRSPALALAILADRLGPGREWEAAQAVAGMSPAVDPNPRIVALADRVMGRSGDLGAAWARARAAQDAKGPPEPALIF